MKNPGKILLVEDDELDAEMTLSTLRKIPLTSELVWLETGQEFIDYIDNQGSGDIQLTLLDLKMPMLSGLEALEILRKKAKQELFPIVVLTSSQEDHEIKRCYELGINAFVTKPVTKEAFNETITTLGLFWGTINVVAE